MKKDERCCIIIWNTLRPEQNGYHYVEDNFRYIFLREKLCIFIQISLDFVPKNSKLPLVQVMAW